MKSSLVSGSYRKENLIFRSFFMNFLHSECIIRNGGAFTISQIDFIQEDPVLLVFKND